VLRQIEGVYREDPGRVSSNVTAIAQRLETGFAGNPGTRIPLEAAPEVAAQFLSQHDPVYGGIGDAPKFPQPTILKFLWRTGQRTQNNQMLQAVRTSVTAMCEGGIYDHLGGGFARYSTDAEWLAPHFEKMLYDNAQLDAGLLGRLPGDRPGLLSRGGRGNLGLCPSGNDQPRRAV